ncbi:MAG: ATP-dependent DNA helicase RecG [Bacteroidales bacterium]|nr:ATP-dependent DNA helicase RecG [Bacteroidales bacterium]MBQ1841592.1 ATP-dependent DNA helicase RecG [Bacteroidales bacterium]MBQ2551157.1 ATP-dependent DNA helicase RecG [Bacteroidales bacterium]MBQ3846348.1 ATP-dependent DNA helicase RecG [Bacteroidales bacterium]
MMDMNIQYLQGVGPRRAALLKSELEIETVRDLLSQYPFRYIDRTSFHRIADIVPDQAYIQIKAAVKSVKLLGKKGDTLDPSSAPKGAVNRLSAIVEDDSGEIEVVFFKGIKWMVTRLVVGRVFVFFGKPSVFNGRINLVHPEVDDPDVSAKGGLSGVYASTEKLKNGGITGKVMAKLVASALDMVLPTLKDSLPDYILKEKGLVPLSFALRQIHFPTDQNSLAKASYRLKFEELFLLQLSLLKQKYVRSRIETGIQMNRVGEAFNLCYNSLPYQLTGAQKRVIREIREDMKSGRQMNRLLQGDVGSGKTMVAVLSSLIAVGNGYQACIMAPTEVLAEQHFANVSRYLEPTGVKVVLLTGATGVKARREIHSGLLDGSIGIIIGTHALIEDTVAFKNLGLAVVDEQHRFGVEQRAKLWNKGAGGVAPHVLVMTATPIPRTLAMTLYGDLDVSVIDEMPPGRKPVITNQFGENKRMALHKFMRDQIALGRQIFVVYPLIFESEKLDYQNLEKGYEEIVEAFPLPKYKVAIVHGRQTSEEKNFNMSAFAAGRADILVSTTVIEVGVDVPNASVMVIESAERFGLSQLHQLRGRVGRGSESSYCILMKGQKVSKESQKRLDLLCSTENGFVLAEEDMKMRGPGDLEGTQQSGLPIKLNIASLARDGLILSDARNYAAHILDDDPSLTSAKNTCLLEELRKDRYQVKDYSKIS